MPSQFRSFPDFPSRALPVRGWPDLSRLMLAVVPVLAFVRRGIRNFGFSMRDSWR